MKKLLILVVIALLVWAVVAKLGGSSGNKPVSTTTPVTTGQVSKIYTDPNGKFAFEYPNELVAQGEEAGSSTPTGWSAFSDRPGKVLAKVTIPRDYMPKTNFSEAWFEVGWSNDAQAIRSCTTAPQGNGVDASDATIDGVTYKKFHATDVGAGNYYETTAYRAILDGDCYSLENTIHYTNIGNYDPSMGIKEFDKAQVQNVLDTITKSFAFQVNSD